MAKTHYIPADFDPQLGEFGKPYCYLVQHFDGNYKLTDSYWIKTWEDYLKFVKDNHLDLPKTKGYKRTSIKNGWLMDVV